MLITVTTAGPTSWTTVTASIGCRPSARGLAIGLGRTFTVRSENGRVPGTLVGAKVGVGSSSLESTTLHAPSTIAHTSSAAARRPPLANRHLIELRLLAPGV